jgi:hypothetical protein
MRGGLAQAPDGGGRGCAVWGRPPRGAHKGVGLRWGWVRRGAGRRQDRASRTRCRPLPFEPPDPSVVAEAADGIAVGRWPTERPRHVMAANGELHGRAAPGKRSENDEPLPHRHRRRRLAPSPGATLKLYSTVQRRYDPSIRPLPPPNHLHAANLACCAPSPRHQPRPMPLSNLPGRWNWPELGMEKDEHDVKPWGDGGSVRLFLRSSYRQALDVLFGCSFVRTVRLLKLFQLKIKIL